jgi:hypothetical protein
MPYTNKYFAGSLWNGYTNVVEPVKTAMFTFQCDSLDGMNRAVGKMSDSGLRKHTLKNNNTLGLLPHISRPMNGVPVMIE